MRGLEILSVDDFCGAVVLGEPAAKIRLLKGSLQRCERCNCAVLVEETDTKGRGYSVTFYNLTEEESQRSSASIYSEEDRNQEGHVFRKINHRDLTQDEAGVLAYYEMGNN